MFLRAGFNPREFRRGHAICYVLIVPVAEWKPQRWAQVWRLQSGDIVFLTITFVAWPHTCRVVNRLKSVPGWHHASALHDQSQIRCSTW